MSQEINTKKWNGKVRVMEITKISGVKIYHVQTCFDNDYDWAFHSEYKNAEWAVVSADNLFQNLEQSRKVYKE